jgi:hypothetical protein
VINKNQGKLDEGEAVCVVLSEAGYEGPEVFELSEKVLDEVAVAIKPRTAGRDVQPVRLRRDVGAGILAHDSRTQGVFQSKPARLALSLSS